MGFCDELRAEAGGRSGKPDGLAKRGMSPSKKATETDTAVMAAAANGAPVSAQENWR